MTNSENYLKVGHFRAAKARQVPPDYVLDSWDEQVIGFTKFSSPQSKRLFFPVQNSVD